MDQRQPNPQNALNPCKITHKELQRTPGAITICAVTMKLQATFTDLERQSVKR